MHRAFASPAKHSRVAKPARHTSFLLHRSYINALAASTQQKLDAIVQICNVAERKQVEEYCAMLATCQCPECYVEVKWVQRLQQCRFFCSTSAARTCYICASYIIKSFDDATNNPSTWSRDAIVDAEALSKAILNFEFIITLHIEWYMSYTENLTRAMEARVLDILQVVQHIV